MGEYYRLYEPHCFFDDINNHYSQKYVEDTNILTTNIENTYFNLQIEQIDFVTIKKDIIIKKRETK